tara:strand:+ start:7170 stop:7619 length:450 start_codon:yes stop_codon:yes gene_type:complete
MEDEFYSTIKLVTGEEIFSIVTIDPEAPETLILQDPVVIQVIHGARGSYVRVEPWLHIPQDDFFFINYDKVVTMTEIDEDHDMIEYYCNYLSEKLEQKYGPVFKNKGKKTRPSEKMGYKGTVKDAKKKLEDIFALDSQENKSVGIATDT